MRMHMYVGHDAMMHMYEWACTCICMEYMMHVRTSRDADTHVCMRVCLVTIYMSSGQIGPSSYLVVMFKFCFSMALGECITCIGVAGSG